MMVEIGKSELHWIDIGVVGRKRIAVSSKHALPATALFLRLPVVVERYVTEVSIVENIYFRLCKRPVR